MKTSFSLVNVFYVNLKNLAEESRREEGKVFHAHVGVILHLFYHIDTHHLLKSLSSSLLSTAAFVIN